MSAEHARTGEVLRFPVERTRGAVVEPGPACGLCAHAHFSASSVICGVLMEHIVDEAWAGDCGEYDPVD